MLCFHSQEGESTAGGPENLIPSPCLTRLPNPFCSTPRVCFRDSWAHCNRKPVTQSRTLNASFTYLLMDLERKKKTKKKNNFFKQVCWRDTMRVQGQLHKWVPGAAVMLSMTPDNVLTRGSSAVFFIIRMKFKSLEPVFFWVVSVVMWY